MALTATGIGSGLDINTIVGVLVDAEKVPKEAIFNKTEDTIFDISSTSFCIASGDCSSASAASA